MPRRAARIEEAGAMLHSILDLDDVMVGDIMVHRSNLVHHRCRPAAGEDRRGGAGERPYAPAALARRSRQHHRRAACQGAAARGAGERRQGWRTSISWRLALPPWFVPDIDHAAGAAARLPRPARAFRPGGRRIWRAACGIVTLEDILEEIVGDIEDEHDIEVPGVKAEPDGSYIVDGTVTIRDLNRDFGWRLPDDDAATIAGLVLHEARRIPEAGQVFAFHGFRFEVLERQRNQIRLLKITPLRLAARGERRLSRAGAAQPATKEIPCRCPPPSSASICTTAAMNSRASTARTGSGTSKAA